MPTITSLDNLPSYAWISLGGASRTGNVIKASNAKVGFSLVISGVDIPANNKIQIAFRIDSVTNKYFGCWCSSEFNWAKIEGSGLNMQGVIGGPCNRGFTTNRAPQTIVLECISDVNRTFFTLNLKTGGYDGSSVAGSWQVTFLYLTTDFEPTDPYEDGGYSEEGGGDGSFDNTSDSLDFNATPTLNAVDAGFITLFNPTLGELKSLASYMWANLVSWETLRKLLADPMDAILGLNIVPVAVPDGARRELKVGGIGTGVTMTIAASQYVTVDCGSISLQEYWGSALDYSPYTKVQLFLPYIGFVQLDTDDVMGRTLTIQYKVDILTGACIAQIKSVGGARSSISAVLYTFAGHCAQNIPVTGVNFSQLISAVIGVATTAISAGVAAGAAGAGVAAASAGLDSTIASTAESLAAGVEENSAAASLKAGLSSAKAGLSRAEAIKAQTIANGVNNTVGQVMGVKPTIGHSGSISAVSGMLGIQKPYLVVQRPRQSLANNYRHYVGYPSNIYSDFSDLMGFTSFEQIILEGIPATDSELAELYEIFKGGVYFELYNRPNA